MIAAACCLLLAAAALHSRFVRVRLALVLLSIGVTCSNLSDRILANLLGA
jgi:hypothetical protein